MHKKTILIDLDGVLNQYKGEYNPDFIPPIKAGAYEFLEKLHKKYELKIFTTRDKKLAYKWFNDNDLTQFVKEITNIKVPAWLIIDDRCLQFIGDYEKILGEIEKFKPWYK